VVTGVEYKLQSENYKRFHTAYAAKDVILACGTVSTPHLLMLSGVGPKQHLREFNIPLIRYSGHNTHTHAFTHARTTHTQHTADVYCAVR
jgi:choline dehydrogenase